MSEDKHSPTAATHAESSPEQPASTEAQADQSDASPQATDANSPEQTKLSPMEKVAQRRAKPKSNSSEAAINKAEPNTPSESSAKPEQTEREKRQAKASHGSAGTGAPDRASAKAGDNSGGGPGDPPARESRSSSRGWGTALIVLLLLLIGGLAAGAWWANQQWQGFQQEWTNSQSSWQDERQQLQSTVSQLEDRLRQRDSEMSGLQSEIDETRNDLVNLATRLNEQTTLQESDIQRLEVEYLMRTARHLALLTGDLQQAENLLRQADRMLADFEDLAYLPVREALAQDIQRLREIPMPDVDGLYFELQALAERSLDWQWWPETVDLTEQSGEPRSESETWYGQIWQDVRELITVRYRDDATQNRLTPSEFNHLQGQFRLLMNQAQVALMQGNQTLYEASLQQAMNWLNTGVSQVPQAERILDQLATLRDQTVSVETPEIDRGLTRLQQMIEEDTEESE